MSNKFDETYQFFPCKKANYVNRQDFGQKKFENCAFYGLGRYGAGTITCQKSEGEPEPELVKSRKNGTAKIVMVSQHCLGQPFFNPESSPWMTTCAAGPTWPTWLSSSRSSCSIRKVSSIL